MRAAILTKVFKPGEKIPSGIELVKQYGVARMTVQQALRVLKDEGLIQSRQGSGVYVRERTESPIGLRPHIERAFDSERATCPLDCPLIPVLRASLGPWRCNHGKQSAR